MSFVRAEAEAALTIRWLEFAGDFEMLCHDHDLMLLLYRAVNMVLYFFINTPFDP